MYSDLIAKVVVSSDSDSVFFDNIPQNYLSLKIYTNSRSYLSNSVNRDISVGLRFNEDASSIYSRTRGFAITPGTVGSDRNTGFNVTYPILHPASETTANVFGIGEMDILNYSSTSFFKQIIGNSINEHNGALVVHQIGAGLYRSTNSISRIRVFGQFAPGSEVFLYGIKGTV